MPDLSVIKARARRAIHNRAAVPALYFATPSETEPVDVRVRWHNKIAATGDLDGQYAQALDAIDRLIFHFDDLNVATRDEPVRLKYAGEVVIPGYENVTFSLDQREPSDGPGEVKWTVARLSKPRVL